LSLETNVSSTIEDSIRIHIHFAAGSRAMNDTDARDKLANQISRDISHTVLFFFFKKLM
jgi:hypothetical protein